jgi:hypothetical protein
MVLWDTDSCCVHTCYKELSLVFAAPSTTHDTRHSCGPGEWVVPCS